MTVLYGEDGRPRSMTEAEAIAYLMQEGDLRVPCSRYGRSTSDCAPIAYKLACIQRNDGDGDPITGESLDHAMGLIVNDRDDVEYMLDNYSPDPSDQAAGAGRKAASEIIDLAQAVEEGMVCLVDGSMYSPSTRALPYAEHYYQQSEDVWDAYESAFDEAIDNADVGVYWEEGCLWVGEEDEEEPAPVNPSTLGKLEHGYLTCALWSSTIPDPALPPDNEEDIPADDVYGIEDVTNLEEALEDVRAFYAANEADISIYCDRLGYDDSQVGHDFWLTRNHHGAGFWDRYMGEDAELVAVLKRLTDASHAYGEAYPMPDGEGISIR